jgi:hypothetical protein
MKPKDLVIIHRFGFCDFDDKFYGSIGEILPFDDCPYWYRVKRSDRSDNWDYYETNEIEFLDPIVLEN